jgi:60S ribosomal subunit assembly/export protein LOC1
VMSRMQQVVAKGSRRLGTADRELLCGKSSKLKFQPINQFNSCQHHHATFTMGASKPAGKGKPSSKGGSSSSKKPGGKPRPKPSAAPEGISKRKQKTMALAKPGGAQKSKSITSNNSHKPKRRKYTEAELDIPALNGIVPAGIAKPKGQKKGKTFVDDAASMMAIMSVVNAEKDKNVESKIMRARQLEEVREAKRKEAEERSEEKKAKFVSF